MARIEWKFPIEVMHGKLKKGVFGAAKRTIANADGEQYNFSVFYGKRNTELHPVSTGEQTAREDFKAIAALVAARRKNVTKRIQDQTAFEAQTACKTFTQYLWSVCKAEYEAAED